MSASRSMGDRAWLWPFHVLSIELTLEVYGRERCLRRLVLWSAIIHLNLFIWTGFSSGYLKASECMLDGSTNRFILHFLIPQKACYLMQLHINYYILSWRRWVLLRPQMLSWKSSIARILFDNATCWEDWRPMHDASVMKLIGLLHQCVDLYIIGQYKCIGILKGEVFLILLIRLQRFHNYFKFLYFYCIWLTCIQIMVC